MIVKILKFGAAWCGPCRFVDAELDKITEVPIEKIDVDEDPKTADKYDIANVPVVIFLNEDGEEVKRHVGLITKDAIMTIVNDTNTP